MFKAVIFDMDGVLVDNFRPWMEFDRKFLAQFNIIPDDAYTVFVNGRSQEEVTVWLKERYQLRENVADIWAAKEHWVRKVYEEDSQPMSGIENLLKKIKAKNFRLALCSGAKLWMIEIILNRFNWRDYFEAVVSSDHVGYKGKPDPEIYLYTARLLKIKPEDCVVVEDAENGVAAAKNAGMKCVGFKDPRFNLPDDLAKADLVVNSLEDEKIISYLGL